MPKVKLESLQEGMIVATDVRNMDNMLLIPAGCALTEKHIHILNAWGIAEIQIEATDESEDYGDILKKLPPEVLAKLTDDTRALFWDPAARSPVLDVIFDLVLRRKAKQVLTK